MADRNEVLRKLRDHLVDMQLHDETDDPYDNGYMAAVQDIWSWLEDEGWGLA